MRLRVLTRALGIAAVATLAVAPSALAGARVTAANAKPTAAPSHWCNTNGATCVEPYQNWEDFPFFHRLVRNGVKIGEYIGHDEPSALFYSNRAGSGNDTSYDVTLPKDPPVKPRQDGSGGTWNFQLRPTFWLGMAMCDDQSAPNPAYPGAPYPTQRCRPGSDANIHTSDTASSPDYIGKGPGSAFMEMQFYPPGWVDWPAGISCDARRWCAALNIDSLSTNMNTGAVNNEACLNSAGLEYVNFAFITKDGRATAPANPLDDNRFNLSPGRDYFMNPGDHLRVRLFDRAVGFTVVIRDLTAGTRGKMVASTANGFASVKFDPSAHSCSLVPHAFHPEYSTSSPATRVPWAAHSYNVAYSDEIGHFELCNKVDVSSPILACASGGGFDTNNVDPQDDNYCLPIPGLPSSRIDITGCFGGLVDSDQDFDGVSYNDLAWPGAIANRTATRLLVTKPVEFSSPTTAGRNYSRVAFETDLPRIEDLRPDAPFGGVTGNCQRFIANPSDPSPGLGCVNPPPQSRDYPFFVARGSGGCIWAEVGGTHIGGIRQAFGGNPQREFGSLLDLHYPTAPAGTVTQRFNDFQRVLPSNPCPS